MVKTRVRGAYYTQGRIKFEVLWYMFFSEISKNMVNQDKSNHRIRIDAKQIEPLEFVKSVCIVMSSMKFNGVV